MVTSPESVVMPINDETILTCEMNLLPDRFQWRHYPVKSEDASRPKPLINLGTAYFVDIASSMYSLDKKISKLKIKVCCNICLKCLYHLYDVLVQ